MRTIPTPAQTDDRAVLSKTIIAQFRTGMRELRCMSGDRMRRTELSFTNTHLLSMLDRHGEMAMSRLAEMLDVSLSNASGVIDRLEDRGLVERVRVTDDRRVVHVRATDLGRAALTSAEVLKDDLVLAILARLDDRRLQRLADALEDVRLAATQVFAADPDLARHEHVNDGPGSTGHDHPQPTGLGHEADHPDIELSSVPASPA